MAFSLLVSVWMRTEADVNETKQRLEAYVGSGARDWARQAAADSALLTEGLVNVALAEIRGRRVSEAEENLSALIVLNERVVDEKAVVAHKLLASVDVAQRELGARVMREFCRLDHAPSAHAASFVESLSIAAANEADLDALLWQLSALGWQKHASARPTMLRYVNHDDDDVRETVANNLWLTADVEKDGIPSEVMDALVRFASEDPSPEVRSCVLYDVAAWPQFFRHDERWLHLCQQAVSDESEDVRRWALRALEALLKGRAYDDVSMLK